MQGNETLVDINGPSAMPSLHVAVTALLAFHSRRYYPRVFPWMAGYTACILLGAVMLGWHYAIDGYAGAGVAWLIWLLTARMFPESPDELTEEKRPS